MKTNKGKDTNLDNKGEQKCGKGKEVTNYCNTFKCKPTTFIRKRTWASR